MKKKILPFIVVLTIVFIGFEAVAIEESTQKNSICSRNYSGIDRCLLDVEW